MPHPVPNTFGFDIKTSLWLEYRSEPELPALLASLSPQQRSRIIIVGQGSNLLFLRDPDCPVLHSLIRGIRILSDDGNQVLVETGSGVIWDDFVAWAVQTQLYGAENLSAIPGETGAAAVQNIGAYGVEVKDIIHEVRGWDIDRQGIRVFKTEECGYAYRESIFKNPPLHNRFAVTSVTFRLSRSPRFNLDYGNLRSQLSAGNITLPAVRDAVIRIRREKLPDPASLGNAGSFFKNPLIPLAAFRELQLQWPEIPHYPAGPDLVKVPAAWLIEQCGWKGRTVNGAGVYEKQPLVLVNRGDARPADIVSLANQIIASIREKFNITISPEVNFVE